jgi:hypothetical protein
MDNSGQKIKCPAIKFRNELKFYFTKSAKNLVGIDIKKLLNIYKKYKLCITKIYLNYK